MPTYKNVFDTCNDSILQYDKENAWKIYETKFEKDLQGKCESIFCLGNGYMGIRSALDENYTGQTRGMFIVGTYNRFDEAEVSELPNAADLFAMEIRLNGEEFNLETGETQKYCRSLDLKTATLHREVSWTSPQGVSANFEFNRFVSFEDLHTVGQRVVITPEEDVCISIRSGINGKMTNKGSQHFSDGDKRFYDKKYMQYVQTTTQHKINVVLTSGVEAKVDGKVVDVEPFISMDQRILDSVYTVSVKKGETLELSKISYIATSFDLEFSDKSLDEIKNTCLEALKKQCAKGYDTLENESIQKWNDVVWDNVPVTIESDDSFNQLAVRFAQYHLHVMAPAHDSRMSIAAKGLSGEGYKGHVFWDNEIFTLPYFIYSKPEIARSLCKYRYLSLPGAHKKASSYGYKGAMYPWESARLDEGEVTPLWGAADIVTGEPIKIWSGIIQQHITADVVFGIWQYYKATGDKEFMLKYGYEVIFDTAIFWLSRLEYDEGDSLYHINDVMGPDEYKEHVNDNAFTNYMAHWNIGKAIECYSKLKGENPDTFDILNNKLDLSDNVKKFTEVIDKIYLPLPREDSVLPQDRTYLSLKDIDLTKYKNQANVGEIFHDYNLKQINEIQVSKQADVMILFLLQEALFSHEVKQASWNYYEPRTLHDSSLSLSTHAILAADMQNHELAYELFNRCAKIDLGENMKTSDAGIHTASIGGIWQVVVYGFGGVRMLDGKLRISPALPESWKRLHYYLYWQEQKLSVELTHEKLHIVNLTGTKEISFTLYDEEVTFQNEFIRDFS